MSDDTSTATIEAPAHHHTTMCETLTIGDTGTYEVPCGRPAVFVVEFRHCTPYRLACCTYCFDHQGPWVCRKCTAPFDGFGNLTVVGRID